MTLETTSEAIEADLQAAEMGGVPRGQIALVRAQIRATLAAAQPPALPPSTGTPDFLHLPTEGGSADIQIAEGPFGDSYSVPTAASTDDRIEAAARLLGVNVEALRWALQDHSPRRTIVTTGPTIEAPTDVELDIEPADDGIDEDFFAEARKSRGK